MYDQITPIFILGSPRSGTTLISSYLGTSPEIENFGELGVFYFARFVSRYEYRRTMMPLMDEYFSELEDHAKEFSIRKARERNAKFFCDSKPFNIRIVDFLAKKFPDAVFILMLRHYSGVIQSLERSYHDGYKWAGDSFEKRAAVWSEMYSHVNKLPFTQLIPLSYDKLCYNPNLTLSGFREKLTSFDIPINNLITDVFVESHATTTPRNTIGSYNTLGQVVLRSIPSFNRQSWSKEINKLIEPIVYKTNQILLSMFPEDYNIPNGWNLI